MSSKKSDFCTGSALGSSLVTSLMLFFFVFSTCRLDYSY